MIENTAQLRARKTKSRPSDTKMYQVLDSMHSTNTSLFPRYIFEEIFVTRCFLVENHFILIPTTNVMNQGRSVKLWLQNCPK